MRRTGQCVLHLLAEDEGGKRQGIQGTARPHRVREELKENIHRKEPVLRIRIRIQIHLFLGRGMDPDPDPAIIKQKY